MHKIGLLPFTAWLMSDKRHSWCWHPSHSHPGSTDIFFLICNSCKILHLLQLLQLLYLLQHLQLLQRLQILHNLASPTTCTTALSALPFTSYTGRYIDALHIRSRYILRSWIRSPDGQIWSDVFRQATFTANLNKVVDCCWSSIARILPILWFDYMHIWGSSHCVIFSWQYLNFQSQ